MKLRMQITKDRNIRFISHLEYLRTIGRAIRRAKLPAAYSEGFNPHLKYSLASALSVGVVSYAEFVEIELTGDVATEEAARALDKALPRGIRVLAADQTDKGAPALMSQAAGAEYRITLPWEEGLQEAVKKFNDAPSLLFKKAAPKSKEKFKEVDVKFYIPGIRLQRKGSEAVLLFDCRITSGGSIKAADLIKALNEHFDLALPVTKADIERMGLYRMDADGGRKLSLLGADAFVM